MLDIGYQKPIKRSFPSALYRSHPHHQSNLSTTHFISLRIPLNKMKISAVLSTLMVAGLVSAAPPANPRMSTLTSYSSYSGIHLC